MKAKEYYKSTRMVDTKHWTLEMAMNFAEEYHKNEMEALSTKDVNAKSEQFYCRQKAIGRRDDTCSEQCDNCKIKK